jgi:hypothetical protein
MRRNTDRIDDGQRPLGSVQNTATAFNEWLADALGTSGRDAADPTAMPEWTTADTSNRLGSESAGASTGRRVVDAQLQVMDSDEFAGPARQDPAQRQILTITPEAIRTAGTVVTAGLVWWLTRSGGLLTSMLMGVPAWRHIDLLPVLSGPYESDEDALDEHSPQPDATTDSAECERDEQLADLFDREATASTDLKEPS